MTLPEADDYIDIHTHGGISSPGIYILETLMAHERRMPVDLPGIAYSVGIHPWFLDIERSGSDLDLVESAARGKNVIAIGETGFDKLKGPGIELQGDVFEEHVKLSEKLKKPLIIHCVKAWDELLASHRKMKPVMPWLIHGFRGNFKLASQLTARGFYLSLWFDFALRPESSELIKQLPAERLFLETDGADVKIEDIYLKTSADRNIPITELKSILLRNFNSFFFCNPISRSANRSN